MFQLLVLIIFKKYPYRKEVYGVMGLPKDG
jgi:hypothetical protein